MKLKYVDAWLLWSALWRPRFWGAVPWRAMSLINKRMGNEMRRKYIARKR